MPSNYVLLRKITLTESAASVTFSNLPLTGYTDLVIKYSHRITAGSNVAHTDFIKFNNLATNFSYRQIQGSGSGNPTSGSDTNGIISLNNASPSTANTFASVEIYIANYASTTAHKSYSVDCVTENSGTTAYIQPLNGRWANNAAIYEVNIDPDTGNLAVGTEFSIYGVAAVGVTPALAPFATGGDSVTTDGTYWYHAFLSSGQFIPTKALTCDALVVAGGGGGGTGAGAGGGAGGLLTFTSQSFLANTSYNAIVGAGGAGGRESSPLIAYNGFNSRLGSLTECIGGGGGGSYGSVNQQQGATGGSGGGSAGNSGTPFGVQTNFTSGQGFGGGAGIYTGGISGGGGGGGASQVGYTNVGQMITNPLSGKGGEGATSALLNAMGAATLTGQLSGGNYYYAGGGGAGNFDNNPGAAGGLGGGGQGGQKSTLVAVAGTANTGGGGGGGTVDAPTYTPRAGANGGAGIVIIRYPIA